jgi:2-polyprenyl-3-methyl-5-hydroxy-6-metoxy-1,4-benzoquinol methylase
VIEEAVCTDISRGMLDELERSAQKLGVKVTTARCDAQELPFADDSFDLVVCVEVLEHLVDPARGLRELARVGNRHLLLSVPREPIFRSCNLFTGRYVKDLGNTPGHFNHWSTRSFKSFVSQVATVREVSTPFPWTVIWATLPD